MSEASAGSATPVRASPDHRNEILLVGRLAAVPEVRTLPSGDVLATFRLVVGRPAAERAPRTPRGRAVTVDTLDCVAWRGAVRRAASRWAAGDLLEVTGALRRRFWRSTSGAASRCEVEVAAARRLRRGGQ